MAKKPSKAGRIQMSKSKKKVQDALHDADATHDDDIKCPTQIDKEPKQGEPKDLPFTQETKPDRLDAITVMNPVLLPLRQSATICHLTLPLNQMKIHTPAMVRIPPFPK
jgi:hypothetical protein